MKSYVSAIKAVLAQDGYQWNDDKLLLSAITCSCKETNDTLKDRRPIQLGLLELILFRVEKYFRERSQYYLEILYKTVHIVAYYGLFRVGELTLSPHAAKACDIHVDSVHEKFMIILYSSKTHSYADRPQKIRISKAGEDSDRHHPRFFCPFKLMQEFLLLRGDYADETDQLFVFSDGSPLQSTQFRQLLKMFNRFRPKIV